MYLNDMILGGFTITGKDTLMIIGGVVDRHLRSSDTLSDNALRLLPKIKVW